MPKVEHFERRIVKIVALRLNLQRYSSARLICKDEHLNIMFKVGEYYESEIKAISSYLKDAGFKVDIKGLVTVRMDHTATRQGKLSELKGRLAGFELYDRFMAAVRAVVEKADSRESFIDLMLTELDPNWKTVRDRAVMGEEDGQIDEDTREADIRSIAEYALAIEFANNLLELNSINPGGAETSYSMHRPACMRALGRGSCCPRADASCGRAVFRAWDFGKRR